MQKKCKICIKNYEIIVDLNDTETAKKFGIIYQLIQISMCGVKKSIFMFLFLQN